eukprot:233154_1
MDTCFIFWTMIGVIITTYATEMKLSLLPKDTKGGTCLDGSPAGFYYSAPPSGSSNLWIIFIKGGGACYDQHSCTTRANSSLGSSTFWNTTMDTSDINLGGVLSDDPIINPDFYTGHHVFAPYCSGDVWSGQRTEPSNNPDTWGLYFSGHEIFSNIMKYLSQHSNILDA